MAWRRTDELIPTDPSSRPGRQFLGGFAEGFGFGGLFATLKQEPLPFADQTQAEPDESDRDLANIVTLLAKYDRASVPGRVSSPEGTMPARAAE